MGMSNAERYYLELAAAFVRGQAAQGTSIGLPSRLAHAPLDTLTVSDAEEVFAAGRAAGLSLHKFKRTMALPRVRRVFGVLHALAPAEMLDIGSGRGVFLWPLLDSFPRLA